MTIYGVGYRALQYVPEPVWKRLRPLASIEFRSLFRGRWGTALFFLCSVQALISLFVMLGYMRVLQIEGIGRVANEQMQHSSALPTEAMRFMPDRVQFYLEPVINHAFGLAPFLILTALVSSRSIAKDHATNAMELTWTRGISPRGYFLAKWFGSAGLLLLTGALASLVIWIVGVFLAEDWGFLAKTWVFMPRTLLALLFFTIVMSYLPVALSALANTANMGSILWVMLLMGSIPAGAVLAQGMRDQSWMPLLSVWDAAGTLARAIAGLDAKPAAVRGALGNLGVVTAVLSVLMVRRMRLKEAVG